MSCATGNCNESIKRQRAIILLGLMMLIFIMLSAVSFLKSRGQVTPDMVKIGPHVATEGKRVFQAYNCMGCHTLVGNGAYFAPDLTEEYRLAGPAWLAAFLPSAAGWPTEGALLAQLANKEIAADAGVTTIEDYYEKFPGAKERVERRGGGTTYMPNLPFRENEVIQLIAYLKYTSEMNTEGWPPEIKVGGLEKRLSLAYGASKAATIQASATMTSAAGSSATAAESDKDLSPEERGEQLATLMGCIACHSPGTNKLVGPPWGGLFGSKVTMTDGTTVTADEAYLVESIVDPNAKTVEGYPPGIMPPYAGIISPEGVDAIVAYIRTLEKK